MISKAVLVFWTVICFLIGVKIISTSGHSLGAFYGFVILGFTWAIIAAPTALIGSLFKKDKGPKPSEKYVLIGSAACAVVLCAFAWL
jgi:hypothetical protein